MKKLCLFSLILGMIVSCGPESPSNGKVPVSETTLNDGLPFEYQPLSLEYDGILQNIPPMFEMDADPNNSSSIRVKVSNSLRDSFPVVVDTAGLVGLGLSIDDSCSGELSRASSCFIDMVLNENEDMTPDTSNSGNLSITVNGVEYLVPVTATINPAADLNQMATQEMQLSSSTLDFGNVFEGSRNRLLLRVKNLSRRELPLNVSLTNTIADLEYDACSASMGRKRVCYYVFRSKNSLAAGSYSDTITVAGQTVNLQLNVEAEPVLTETSNKVIYENRPVGDSILFTSSDSLTMTIRSENRNSDEQEPLFYDFTPVGGGLDYPQAFVLNDNCPNSLDRLRKCELSFNYDSDRFHYNVTFLKEVSFNNSLFTIELEGSSPCSNPLDPMYQAGTKLNAAKTACVPNEGVFDSPDSVFGHTVFQ